MPPKRRYCTTEILDILWQVGSPTDNPDIKEFQAIDLEIKAGISMRSSYRYLHYPDISPFIQHIEDGRWIVSRKKLHDIWIEPIALLTAG